MSTPDRLREADYSEPDPRPDYAELDDAERAAYLRRRGMTWGKGQRDPWAGVIRRG